MDKCSRCLGSAIYSCALVRCIYAAFRGIYRFLCWLFRCCCDEPYQEIDGSNNGSICLTNNSRIQANRYIGIDIFGAYWGYAAEHVSSFQGQNKSKIPAFYINKVGPKIIIGYQATYLVQNGYHNCELECGWLRKQAGMTLAYSEGLKEFLIEMEEAKVQNKAQTVLTFITSISERKTSEFNVNTGKEDFKIQELIGDYAQTREVGDIEATIIGLIAEYSKADEAAGAKIKPGGEYIVVGLGGFRCFIAKFKYTQATKRNKLCIREQKIIQTEGGEAIDKSIESKLEKHLDISLNNIVKDPENVNLQAIKLDIHFLKEKNLLGCEHVTIRKISTKIDHRILKNSRKGEIYWNGNGDALEIPVGVVKESIKESLSETLQLIDGSLNSNPDRYHYFVGGLMKTPYIKSRLKMKDQTYLVYPDHPETYSVKGARLYGTGEWEILYE